MFEIIENVHSRSRWRWILDKELQSTDQVRQDFVYVDLELRMQNPDCKERLPRSSATLMKSAVAVHFFSQSWNDSRAALLLFKYILQRKVSFLFQRHASWSGMFIRFISYQFFPTWTTTPTNFLSQGGCTESVHPNWHQTCGHPVLVISGAKSWEKDSRPGTHKLTNFMNSF